MPIALGVLLVAVLAVGFMSMQAMLERLNQVEDTSGLWQRVLSPFTTALNLLNRGQRFVWKELVAIMSRFAGASIRALADWFHALESLARDAAGSVASLAETVADAFEHALTVTVPHQIKVAVRHEAGLRKIADDALRRYARGIDRLLREQVIPGLRALRHTVTVTIPHQFERVAAREKAIAARIPRALSRRLTRLEKITTYAAIAAVVVRVLARRFPWLFCRKVSTLGKRVCGLNGDLFDTFLTDLLVIGGALSVVEFAKDLQRIEDEVVGFMKEAVPELRDLIE